MNKTTASGSAATAIEGDGEFQMRLIENLGITDASRNLALEGHVLRTVEGEDSFLLFYDNSPAIIIGRNQKTIEEINAEAVRERGMQVVRRMSGGGAVYHDLGNLNFSFLTSYAPERFNRYAVHTTGSGGAVTLESRRS